MPEDRTRHDVLARIAGTPHLARAVPLLPPEVLHAVIAHYGLQDCGELLALATSEQLAAVFDLDLWRTVRAGADEEFDPRRFTEWLEVLADSSPTIAAARLAAIDVALVVAGLSPHVKVFDPAALSPEAEPDGSDAASSAGRARGLHADIGGYVVVARRAEAWDAIVEVLCALEERHPETFHRVMRGCRRLSDSGRETDGLDDLLPQPAQARFDLSLGREHRRDRLGFLPPQQARAFLDSARHLPLVAEPAQADVVFAAHQRSLAVVQEAEMASPPEPAEPRADEPPASAASGVASVIDALRGAGVLAQQPRGLLSGARDDRSSGNAALRRYLQLFREADDTARTARNQELAFLANALVAGSSVKGRPFTRREAADAAAATCNLGIRYWPQPWGPPSQRNLVTVFKVGWSVLHRDVSMLTAERLLEALDTVRTSDLDLQLGLHVLRHQLHRQWLEGTPWHVRDRLDVLASLDLPAWAALTALFDECPVMLANVSQSGSRRPSRVNPSEFQFIAEPEHIAAVHAFVCSLAEQFAR